ncbi:hypothetical protein NQ314_013207, partial [Rhamnusium bicolor]
IFMASIKKHNFKSKLKRQLFQYSEDALQRAVLEIRDNNLGIREASRQFSVPKSTIQDRLKGCSTPKKIRKPGPQPLLTVEGGQNSCVGT